MKFKRLILLFAFITLLFASITGACAKAVQSTPLASPESSQAYPQAVDNFRELVRKAMETDGITGLSVALVDDEHVIWAGAFGYTDRSQRKPVDLNTIFSIQSMTKTITGTAVMHAVQDGLLDLDVPITTYLPDFTVNSIYEEHPEQKITMRHLLSHTAGFTHEAPVGSNFDSDAASFEEHIKSISDTWLRLPVGADYSYSNLGVDLAGYILGKVSGKGFQAYVDSFLNDQVGMTNSTVDMVKIESNPNRAVGHSSFIWRMPLQIPMIPSGGLYSSADDMAKFIQYHLKNKDLYKEMYEIPFAQKGQTEGYGLGVEKVLRNRTYMINHNGGGYGFSSSISFYPELKIGVVVLTNTADTPKGYIWPYDLGNSMLDSVINDPTTVYYSRMIAVDTNAASRSSISNGYLQNKLISDVTKGLRAVNNAPAPDTARWQGYTGQYGGKYYGAPFYMGPYMVSEKNGELFFGNAQLHEVQPGLFFTEDGEAIDFRDSTPAYRNMSLEKLDFGLDTYMIIGFACAAVLIFTILLWPLTGLIRRISRKENQSGKYPWRIGVLPKLTQVVYSLALLAGIACIAFLVMMSDKSSSIGALSLADLNYLRLDIQTLTIISPLILALSLLVLAFAIILG
jgi:CubicO group peptidase (beta-lactamase class C family)